VEASIYEEFTATVAAKARRIKIGHPLDPETVIGPVIHPVHERKVLEYLAIGKREGATIAAGGGKVEGPGGGCYIAPTLFTGARNDMRIAQEEIFGPVLTAIPFKDEAEALALANEVQYGLTGYLWTSDVTRALRFTDQLDAGNIWVNSENVRHLPTPFGGVKGSGIGATAVIGRSTFTWRPRTSLLRRASTPFRNLASSLRRADTRLQQPTRGRRAPTTLHNHTAVISEIGIVELPVPKSLAKFGDGLVRGSCLVARRFVLLILSFQSVLTFSAFLDFFDGAMAVL
jgi:delta 1-pyrroline-5-carboxylate dehydrogenase